MKPLKMVVRRPKVEDTTGPRSLLAIEFNKDTLLEAQSRKFQTSAIFARNVAKVAPSNF